MLGASVGLGWSVYKSTQMMSFVEAWVAVSASVIVSLAVYGLVTFHRAALHLVVAIRAGEEATSGEFQRLDLIGKPPGSRRQEYHAK